MRDRKLQLRLMLDEVKESFTMAVSAVAAHKLRSSLTLLGVVVGVFSIILVMTAIRALQSNIESGMNQLGSQTFQIQKWPAFQVNDRDWEKYMRRKDITLRQAQLLRERASLAKAVGVRIRVAVDRAKSRYRETNPNVFLDGVMVDTFATRDWNVAEGRGLTESDIELARHVGVLGANLAKKLFPQGSAVGETIKFQGVDYKVLGVLEAKGSIFGNDQDTFIAVPVTTAVKRYGRYRSMSIQVQARDQASYQDTVEQVRGAMRAIRKVEPGAEDDFDIFSNESLIAQFRSFTLAVRAGAGVLSSVALLAAGIGIMNIMLVSVTERTREIGIRRAIGAKKRNIMTQFILEAIILCEIGGVIGVILGIAAGNVAAFYIDVPAVIPVDWAIFGLVVCSMVGIIFGTYPAYKAANLDPIESLRYE